MKYEVAFIGSGNVAWHLAHAMDRAGHTIAQVLSKNEDHAKELAVKFGAHFGNDLNSLYTNVDVCFICVPDDEIKNVVRDMPSPSGVLVHTCGPKSMDILAEKAALFGVFYPLQSFTKHRKINMLEVPIFLESSSNQVFRTLSELADSISNKVSEANSEARLRYHLAAVFANNFVNYLYGLSKDYLDHYNLDFSVLLPIIQETALKIKTMDPAEAQTGPASRHDQKSLEKHLEMLSDKKDWQALYKLISDGIQSK